MGKLVKSLIGHIEVDLRLLQQAVGKNTDEAALLVHIILLKIMCGPSPQS